MTYPGLPVSYEEGRRRKWWWDADGDYKVIHDGDRWWDFPYCAYGPDGMVVSCCATLWGARRTIRRHRRRRAREVYREPA